MADNAELNAGTGGATVAADEVTYSGDTAIIQVIRPVHVSGAEGAKTVAEVFGAAGTAATPTLTIQGIASMTAVQVADNGGSLTIDNAGITTIAGAVSGTEMQVDIVASIPAGTNNIGDVDVLSIVPGTGATNLGKAIDTATGATDTGVLALATRDDALTTLTPADGDNVQLRTTSTGALWVANAGSSSIIVDDAAFTAGTTPVSMVGFVADEGAAADSADTGDGVAVRATLDRLLMVVPTPHANQGLSIFRTLDADETEEEVKGTAGTLYGMWVTNTGNTTAFVKLYNATAANVTVGSTTPVITIGIPGNTSDDVSANFGPGGHGIFFDTAITVAAVTEAADNGTTAPGANSVIVNIFYK